MDFTPNFLIYIICWNSEVWCVSVQLLLRSISLQYALNAHYFITNQNETIINAAQRTVNIKSLTFWNISAEKTHTSSLQKYLNYINVLYCITKAVTKLLEIL